MKRFTIIILSAFALMGSASATVITFEELGAQPNNFASTNPLRNEYAGVGVKFWGSDGSTGVNGGAILDQSSNFGTGAFSGSNFLAFNGGGTMLNGGTAKGPEYINFGSPASTVSAMVAVASSVGSFTFDAFDSGNNLVGSNTIRTQDWAMLSVSGNNIAYVVFSFQNDNNIAILDDLTFDVVPEPVSMFALGAGLLALVRRRRS